MDRILTIFQRLWHHFAALVLIPPPSLRGQEFFQRDLRFQLAYGCSQAVVTSIAFIIIKQTFQGSDTLVALVQSGVMAGLLCSLLYSNRMAAYRPTLAFAVPHTLGWIALIASIFSQTAISFSWLIALASFLFAISSPFQGMIYGLIYRRAERGKVVSLLKQWQTLAAVIAAWLLGRSLDWSADAYRWVFLPMAMFGIWTAKNYASIRIPVEQYLIQQQPKLFASLRCLKDDLNFSKFLTFQFILGLSNIAGVTVMHIYVNDKNFLNASPSTAAWITGILPPLCMFFSLRIWGGIFDRISIIHYRAVTSLAMAIGFLVYPFLGVYGALIGGLIWGLGRGGGQLAWSIGILSFAQSHRSSEYLATHTFLTGMRGVIAPFIGVWAIHSGLSPQQLFWTVAALIALTALATITLVQAPEIPDK